MTNDTMIGVDLAKSVFQLHAASATGQFLFRKKLSRSAFAKFMAEHPPVTIVIAAQRPEMRFVEPKSAEQQSQAMLFHARSRLVRQRTELTNMLRAFLY